MGRSRQRTVALIAALAATSLVATACAGDDDGETAATTTVADTATTTTAGTDDGATTTTAGTDEGGTGCEGEPTASMPGITETEVRIGVAAQDTARLADIGLGIDLGDVVPEEVFQLFIDEVNAAGGVCGRQLVLDTFAAWDVLTDGAEQAACVQLTQDTEVAVVLTTAGWPQSAAQCTAIAGERLLIADAEYTADVFDAAEGRLFTFAPAPEDTLAAMVRYGAAEGLFDGSVGLLYGSDEPDEGDTVEGVVLSVLEELGITAETCRLSQGAGGATGTTEVALCMEQFSAAGVTTVISGTDLFSMMLARLEAVNIGYEATWLGSSYPNTTNVSAGPLLFESFGGTDAMDGQIGLTPVGDFAELSPEAEDCLAVWQEATGGDATNVGQLASITNICTMVRRFADAVSRAGINPTQADLIAALEDTGPFTLASGVEGAWSADRHTAGEQLRVVQFSAAAGAYETVRDFQPIDG
jgi:hypothetical protein